jgi:hypothetical protein
MFTNMKFYENSFGGCRFVSCGQTDMDRYGEANYCAVDGAGHFKVIRVVACVTGVNRWTARVGCVVDSKVCLHFVRLLLVLL